jgi:DNA invertase Pin-like site-specific DNA recombinase
LPDPRWGQPAGDEGRKPSVPVEEVRRLRGEGKGPAEIAEALGVSRMSVWRALNAGAA